MICEVKVRPRRSESAFARPHCAPRTCRTCSCAFLWSVVVLRVQEGVAEQQRSISPGSLPSARGRKNPSETSGKLHRTRFLPSFGERWGLHKRHGCSRHKWGVRGVRGFPASAAHFLDCAQQIATKVDVEP